MLSMGVDPQVKGHVWGLYLGMPKLAHGCHSLPYSLGDSSDVASGYQYCSNFFTLVAVSVIIC